MNYEEFGQQLSKLQDDLLNAKIDYRLLLALWPTEDVVGILNRWKGFFTPVRSSLYEMTILRSARVFDHEDLVPH